MLVVVKTLQDMIHQLSQIVERANLVEFDHVRKFILSCLNFIIVEITLYSAFQAPVDDLFYLPEDSFEWRLINENLEVNPVEDEALYLQQLRQNLNNIFIAGAATFNSGVKENRLTKVFSFMKHSAAFQMSPGAASDQFRYFQTTNLHNHELILKFFNLINENKLVKSSFKVMFDSIETNQKLYVPMLTREFTLEESLRYDSMTDAKFNELASRVQEQISGDAAHHTDEGQHNPSTHVKVRLIHNQRVARDNIQRYDYAIIHFHGGGFMCQDSFAH